jgi:hypothetical protein
VTGVQWTELPPGAPEPPPLSVVRDVGRRRWLHEENGWELLDGEYAGDTMEWAYVAARGPLLVAKPEGVPWPLVESVGPSPYEVRDRALGHASRATSRHDAEDAAEHADNVLWTAERFEGYLRDGTRPES